MTSKTAAISMSPGKKREKPSSLLTPGLGLEGSRSCLSQVGALLAGAAQEAGTSATWYSQERSRHSRLMHMQKFNAKLSEEHMPGAHLLLSFGQLSIQQCATTPKETFRIISLWLRGFQAAGEVGIFSSALKHSSGTFFQAWLFPQTKKP